MSKKNNKNNKNNKNPQPTNQQKNSSPPAQVVPNNTSETEINNKIVILLEELKEKREEKESLSNEIKELQRERDESKKFIDAAKAEADEILKKANDDKIKIVAETQKNVRNALNEQYKDLIGKISKVESQHTDLLLKESELRKEKDEHEKKKKGLSKLFEKEKREFEAEKDVLSEELAYSESKKESYKKKYEECKEESDAKEDLKIEYGELKSSNEELKRKIEEQTKKFVELQNWADSIRIEIGDSSEGNESTSIKALLWNLEELKREFNSLKQLHEKYPNIHEIADKAKQFDRNEQKYKDYEETGTRLREIKTEMQYKQEELKILSSTLKAKNALNEHLLKELESHKTALESRTGDTCPSLTKVDTEEIPNSASLGKRIPLNDLKEIVSHIKNYAGSEQRSDRLFYSDNDIRAFLAGMAVSHLIILQGMSGTGKSSLPRIFAEAISGENHLNPVESSWRDRNELLGYYNDFNKKFNAKKFTIDLYRSGKKPDTPTFIVLDEMNLARIEYYFSDFLAILQEPDPEKLLIELVPFDMRTLPMELPDDLKNRMPAEEKDIYKIWEKIEESRKGKPSETTDEEKAKLSEYLGKLNSLTGAKDLVEGRKIKITNNIWFVGTANRDESTFEITDKVYDRAQVVSLDKKGEKGKYDDVTQGFISADSLINFFKEAKEKKETEVEEKLKKLDKLLMEEFDVSFGNRIVKQTTEFVAVFKAAGGEPDIALDYQISTKILRKVITSDNKKAFLELQKITSSYPKTAELIKKRIKELS
jgi:hypothetical protein